MARTLTTQDVSWFLDLNEKGQLDLDPPYQRRSVWSPKDRRYFIDTILNNYPAPPVFLHKTIDENGKSTYHVVDGKQRLLTIIDFTLDKVRIPDDFGTPALQGKKWGDLDRGGRETFWNYIIIVEMLPDASEANIRSTFERINRNSRKLSAQEMRHAKYDGWFSSTAEAEADKPEWRDFGIATTARSKRMLDVQFVSELMQITIEKRRLFGFDQNALDDVYAGYDDLADVPDFSEDEFWEQFEQAKEYVKQCVAAEKDISVYIKVQLHFYTLWAYVLFRPYTLLPATDFAPKYLQFLNDVVAYNRNPRSPDVSAPRDVQTYQMAVADYAANARGASTDLAQRTGRHTALYIAIHAPGVAGHEGQ
jgi:hypothetical protein